MRRELCSSPDGFVLGTWSQLVGTGNCLNKVITAALLAIALDRPFVLGTNVFTKTGRRRAFNASLLEAASGYGGMPWLAAPNCIEDTALVWPPQDQRSTTAMIENASRAWCSEVGIDLPAGSVEGVNLRHGPAGPFDRSGIIAHGELCHDFSQARVVVVHTTFVANFDVLGANTALPAAILSRIRALNARGVNSYGLTQRALWPHGLTLISSTERPTVAVHLRCWFSGCSEVMLQAVAGCVASLARHAGPSCSVYAGSDHAYAPEMLREFLTAAASNCSLVKAADFRASLSDQALSEEADAFDAYMHGKKLEHYIATPHDPTPKSADSHPVAWADPIDLHFMSSAETFLGGLGTMSWVAGTRVGSSHYFLNSKDWKNWTCRSASDAYPFPAADLTRSWKAIGGECPRLSAHHHFRGTEARSIE